MPLLASARRTRTEAVDESLNGSGSWAIAASQLNRKKQNEQHNIFLSIKIALASFSKQTTARLVFNK